jgi:hypothetical protein
VSPTTGFSFLQEDITFPFSLNEQLTDNTKKDSIYRNQRTGKIKGEETIENAQTIRYNHGQTSEQPEGSKGQGSISLFLFDLVGRFVKEACTDCRHGCGCHQRSMLIAHDDG